MYTNLWPINVIPQVDETKQPWNNFVFTNNHLYYTIFSTSNNLHWIGSPSISTNALKLCLQNHDPMISFLNVHSLTSRATPDKYCIFKHALLYKIYNNQTPKLDWIALNFNQNFNARNANLMSYSTSNYKIGRNKLSEQLMQLNNLINLNDLNLEYNLYKSSVSSSFCQHKKMN